MKDLTRFESNERVDIGDFNRVAINSSSDQINELIHNFLVNPDGDDRFILSGFSMSNPSGNQVRVEQGKAILHQRYNGEVVESVLSTSGDTYKIVDISTYPNNTYNIYIRFEHVLGDQQGRIFWDPSGTGSEYTQTIPTKYEANWSVRIEASSPGQEWFRIGTVVMPSMSITDYRDMYFEGSVDSTYASGWSSDGGGSANDRNTDRDTYGIVDLRTFVAATKQCLEDIKGRGIRHWYDRSIGGLNIGFDADPIERALYVQSDEFGLTASTTGVYRTLKFTDETYLRYSTTATNLLLRYANMDRITIDSTGTTFTRGVDINADSGYTGLSVQGAGTAVAIEAISETGYNATAIRGTAAGTGYGLQAISSTTPGSYGALIQGASNVALYALSSGNYAAIEAHGGSHGIISYAAANSHGVYGTSGGGTGSSGIYGLADNNTDYGVWGVSSYPSGAGVYGLNSGAGTGMYALNTSSGVGLTCQNSGTGVPLVISPLTGNPASLPEGGIWFAEFGGTIYLNCFIGSSIRVINSWASP